MNVVLTDELNQRCAEFQKPQTRWEYRFLSPPQPEGQVVAETEIRRYVAHHDHKHTENAQGINPKSSLNVERQR